jgi:hypothetical protein
VALLAVQVLIRAMKGTGVRRVVSLVTLCAGCIDGSVGGFGPGVRAKAFPPPDSDSGLPPGAREMPKGGPPKGGLLKEEPRGDAKELLKAGGGLPLPQKAVVPPKADNHGRFPIWRVVGWS